MKWGCPQLYCPGFKSFVLNSILTCFWHCLHITHSTQCKETWLYATGRPWHMLYFCLIFYFLMLSSHAYYAFEVNLLFSKIFFVHRQNSSFPIVLKHDRNRYIIFWRWSVYIAKNHKTFSAAAGDGWTSVKAYIPSRYLAWVVFPTSQTDWG